MESDSNRPLLNPEDLRHVARWAADCAERALPIFEAKAPHDRRPREAIEAARNFAQTGKRTQGLRKAGWAAQASAREVGDPAASAAARAACAAAATAYTHPIATPHQINHILSPAAYGAYATALATTDEAIATEAEIRWAIEHTPLQVRQLVQRLPGRSPSKGRFHAILYRLDICLRRS